MINKSKFTITYWALLKEETKKGLVNIFCKTESVQDKNKFIFSNLGIVLRYSKTYKQHLKIVQWYLQYQL